MDLKELKKLINEEVKRVRTSEATNPGTPKAKMKAAQSAQTVDPDAKTYVTSMPKDPAIPPPESKQPKPSAEVTNPVDFYKGIVRLYNALRDKFDLEMQDREVHELIRDIASEEIEKIRSKHPEMDIGGKLG